MVEKAVIEKERRVKPMDRLQRVVYLEILDANKPLNSLQILRRLRAREHDVDLQMVEETIASLQEEGYLEEVEIPSYYIVVR